jgi:hypothetical protein
VGGRGSAWQRLPDAQVGIVHVNSDNHFDKVLALVSRMAAGRVGVSARFDDLRDTPQALHCAKVTLRGAAQQQPVGVVRQPGIGTQPIASDGARFSTVLGQHDGQLGQRASQATISAPS